MQAVSKTTHIQHTHTQDSKREFAHGRILKLEDERARATCEGRGTGRFEIRGPRFDSRDIRSLESKHWQRLMKDGKEDNGKERGREGWKDHPRILLGIPKPPLGREEVLVRERYRMAMRSHLIYRVLKGVQTWDGLRIHLVFIIREYASHPLLPKLWGGLVGEGGATMGLEMSPAGVGVSLDLWSSTEQVNSTG
eukprot:1351459-Amorphochlora_amoeboformis.AAC.1